VRIVSLHVYPVKSCGGITLLSSDLLLTGLRHDRRFMVVRPDGMFLTQREYPAMVRIGTRLSPHGLFLSTPAGEAKVPLEPEGERMEVEIWEEHHQAVVVSGEASRLLSDHLRIDCRLVFMPPDTRREVDQDYARKTDHVAFADGFPVLLATTASLDDLNERLEHPVPMNRFRPNIVVEGAGHAFEEDKHDAVEVSGITMRMPKRCARCPIITTDQRTGEVSKEPLRTLAKYRASQNKVHFGQNCIPNAEGILHVGDVVRWL
jgi:uncharacterized protein